MGMGVGQIPRSKIRAYGSDDLGIECDDELDRFCAILRKMDDDYVTAANSAGDKIKDKKARQIPMDDVEGIKEMFRSLESRQEAIAKKKTNGSKP